MTRKIMEPALSMLSKRCNVTVNRRSRPASKVEIIKNVADKDAILCTVSDRIDAQVMDAAGSNLKVISSYSSGYDHIDVKEATARGIYVTFTSDVPAEATADLTFALILACARNIVDGEGRMGSRPHGRLQCPWRYSRHHWAWQNRVCSGTASERL